MTDIERRVDRRGNAKLGAALRRALEPRDQDAFVARVVAQFDARRVRTTAWQRLGDWAGRGIAAALLIAFLAGLAARPLAGSNLSLDIALAGGESALLTDPGPPDASAVLVEPEGR